MVIELAKNKQRYCFRWREHPLWLGKMQDADVLDVLDVKTDADVRRGWDRVEKCMFCSGRTVG